MKKCELFSERDEIVPKSNDDDLKRYYSLRPMTITAFKRVCKKNGWNYYSFNSVPCSEDSKNYEKFYFTKEEQ